MSGFDSSLVANLKVTYENDYFWVIPLNNKTLTINKFLSGLK